MVSQAGSAKDGLPLGAISASTATAPHLELHALFTAHYGSIWRLLRRLGVRSAELDDAERSILGRGTPRRRHPSRQ